MYGKTNVAQFTIHIYTIFKHYLLLIIYISSLTFFPLGHIYIIDLRQNGSQKDLDY